jgi:hypothetical protein
MDKLEKNKISHRSRALASLKEYLCANEQLFADAPAQSGAQEYGETSAKRAREEQ